MSLVLLLPPNGGVPVGELDRGQTCFFQTGGGRFMDGDAIVTGAEVVSDKPLLVAQFAHGSNNGGSPSKAVRPRKVGLYVPAPGRPPR